MSTLKKLAFALSIIGVSTSTITTFPLSSVAASDRPTEQNFSKPFSGESMMAHSHYHNHKRKRWIPGHYKVYLIKAHYDSYGRWISAHYIKRWIPGRYIYIY